MGGISIESSKVSEVAPSTVAQSWPWGSQVAVKKNGKIFVSEIWAKMFSVNQIVGFFNEPYLQNKSMKLPDICMLIQIHIN